MKKSVYLDYAAATPIDKKVLSAMRPYFSEQFFNPSALYLASRAVKKALNNARDIFALELAVRPTEIIFTAGGTEANNLAIRGVMEQFPDKKLLISAIEHESIREPAELYDVHLVKVDTNGLLDIADFTKKLNDDTVLVSIIYANNEVGTIQNLKKISEIINNHKKGRSKRGIKPRCIFTLTLLRRYLT